MKNKTKIKLRYAWRTQATLFRHPLTSFRISHQEVNMYQFILHGWKVIDTIVKD